MKVLNDVKVIPVLVIEDASWAVELAQQLVLSGLGIVEVTLRTPQSWDAAIAMREVKGLTLGLGSVTKVSDLERGRDLSIDFAVSAGIRRDLVECADRLGIPYMPGVATPSELLLALDLGLSTVKWFPAETLGGVPALRAISAPFPSMKFIPTGGINRSNALSYLDEKNVTAVGGSWMFPKDAMKNNDVMAIGNEARAIAEISIAKQ